MIPCIQSIRNNTSFLTLDKTSNKIAYNFFLRRPLNLLSDPLFPNTFQARTNMANAISFAFVNQKVHYNLKHQFFFMKVGNWAMLKLHKSYSISSSFGVTKKLTQQYVGLFSVVEKVGCLAHKLDILGDWKIYPVFFVAQLEPTLSPTKDPFSRFRPQQPPSIFVEGNTDHHKSFKIKRLLNKRTVKKGKGLVIKYLVRWTRYRPKWDRWYNVKNLNNASALV